MATGTGWKPVGFTPLRVQLPLLPLSIVQRLDIIGLRGVCSPAAVWEVVVINSSVDVSTDRDGQSERVADNTQWSVNHQQVHTRDGFDDGLRF
jgi:hypothetical protein